MEASQLPEKALFTCTVRCLPNILLCYLRHHLVRASIGYVGCSFTKWPRTVQGTTTLTQSYRPRQPTTNKVNLHYWISQLSFIARNYLKRSPEEEKRAQSLCCCSILFLPRALTLTTSFPRCGIVEGRYPPGSARLWRCQCTVGWTIALGLWCGRKL